jgi:hypothetical protein
MANLLQSSQTQATTAPNFYTDYLSNLATQGQQAAQQAQYVGAQPLQEQAFQMASQNAGVFQPAITQGQQYAGQAARTNILGAMDPYAAAALSTSGVQLAQPYLQTGATMGGLSAANPYLQQATQSPAGLAQQYMNPFINTAVQSMSDIAQRNLQQNLAPQATAAMVGSGQYGSQRGAQVLGQVQRQAEQDLNNQIAQMLTSGYGQALTAAGQQNALLGQMGGTAGTLTNQQAQNIINAGQQLGNLQQAQNQIASGLGATATTGAANQATALNQAAQQMGTLGQTGQNISLADINALATLGGQQQTIAQNRQLFPLTNLSTLSAMLRGYTVPTTTKTMAEQSPLSVLAGTTTGLAGLYQPIYDASGRVVTDPTTGKPVTAATNIGTGLKNLWSEITNSLPSLTTTTSTAPDQSVIDSSLTDSGDETPNPMGA